MISITCPSEQEIWPLIHQEPVPNAVRDHINGCARCQDRLASLVQEVEVVRRAFESDVVLPRLRTPGHAPDDPIPSASDDGETPTHIARYVVRERLNSGGQGDVYLAWDPELRREVAIKLGFAGVDENSLRESRIHHEVVLLALVDHANLARVYDSGVHDGHPFLVMEYVAGLNLQQIVAIRQLTRSEIRDIIGQICGAIEAAHQKGILHLDLKPENVMLTEDGRCKLVDFGVGWLLPRQPRTASDLVAGTVEFMSPEQFSGRTQYWSASTDIFGLGALLYFLLTGNAPGNVTSDSAEFEAGIETAREDLRRQQVDKDLKRICIKALAPRQSERYPDVARVRSILNQRARRRGVLCIAAGCLSILLGFGMSYSATDANTTLYKLPGISQSAAPQQQKLALQIEVVATSNVPVVLFCWSTRDGVVPLEGLNRSGHSPNDTLTFGGPNQWLDFVQTGGLLGVIAVQSARPVAGLEAIIQSAFDETDYRLMDGTIQGTLTIRDDLIQTPRSFPIDGTSAVVDAVQSRLNALHAPFELQLFSTVNGPEPRRHRVRLELERAHAPVAHR